MIYLNCPQCGLGVRVRSDSPLDESCPRCRGRSAVVVSMYATDGPRPPIALGGAKPNTKREPEPKPESRAA